MGNKKEEVRSVQSVQKVSQSSSNITTTTTSSRPPLTTEKERVKAYAKTALALNAVPSPERSMFTY